MENEDINGVEIYEGDIVFLGKVVFSFCYI